MIVIKYIENLATILEYKANFLLSSKRLFLFYSVDMELASLEEIRSAGADRLEEPKMHKRINVSKSYARDLNHNIC
jgi:hypothetical protein